jgi:hypothetical protein
MTEFQISECVIGINQIVETLLRKLAMETTKEVNLHSDLCALETLDHRSWDDGTPSTRHTTSHRSRQS